MQVRVQRKTWIEFQEKMQGPSRRQGSSFMLDQKGRQDRLKVTRLYVVGWGPELEINRGRGWCAGRIRPVRNFQIKSHLAHGGRYSNAIPPLSNEALTIYYY